MTKNKLAYDSPTTQILIFRIKDFILTGSPVFGAAGSAGYDQDYNTYGDDF